MIQLSHITKTFETPKGSFTALDDVSIHVKKGEIFGIIGESGAGKSTLVRCINLLERPSAGSVVIDGQDITQAQGQELREVRRKIGMIFQGLSLFQQRNVLDNVLFSAALAGSVDNKTKQHALELLDLVGLGDKARSYPSQLSGGQQQRVAIARALLGSPSILLCDEATSALDTLTTQTVLELLSRVRSEFGISIVLITHSLAVARQVCDSIAVLEQGKLVEQGTAKDVLEHPQSRVAQALLAFETGKEVN